jgi:hypothetical protein
VGSLCQAAALPLLRLPLRCSTSSTPSKGGGPLLAMSGQQQTVAATGSSQGLVSGAVMPMPTWLPYPRGHYVAQLERD